MNPPVDTDLVPIAPEDFVDHAGMEHRTDGRDEERRRDLVAVEQFEDARQAAHRTEFAGGQGHRGRVATVETQRFVVDVEAQANRDTGTVRPGGRSELTACAYGCDSIGYLLGSPVRGRRPGLL